MLDLERLEELEKAGTPLPWEWVPDKWRGGYRGIVGPENQIVLFPNHCNDGDEGDAWFEDFPSEADRELATEARNALPGLVAEVKRLRKLCRECFTAVTSWDKKDDRWMVLAQEVTAAIRGEKEVAK